MEVTIEKADKWLGRHVVRAEDMHCNECDNKDVDFALVDFDEHALYFDCPKCGTRTAQDTGIPYKEHEPHGR